MKYTCNFILERRKDANGNLITENVPICADINFKQRIRYATGYRVDASRWSDVERKDAETGEVMRIQQVKKMLTAHATKSLWRIISSTAT